jgi:hypothetical protein
VEGGKYLLIARGSAAELTPGGRAAPAHAGILRLLATLETWTAAQRLPPAPAVDDRDSKEMEWITRNNTT